MAFLVKVNARDLEGNSFASVEHGDAYVADRPRAKWTAADLTKKQQALIAASDYIMGRFYGALREDVLALDEVSVTLQNATIEYAVRSMDGPLVPTPVLDSQGIGVVMTRKKIGPIEKEYQLVGNAGKPAMYRSYPEGDMLIATLLRPVGNRVIR